MNMAVKFSIEPVTGQDFHYNLVGSIDAHASETLNTLYDIPAESHVLLDFSQVERVNSMGLSLLLKLFEIWESKRIKIEVQHLDRMISMLFKITGLGRFIKDGKAGPATPASTANPEPPRHIEAKIAATTSTPASTASDKLNFVASLQTGQQLTGWYLLNTYLQRRLKQAIHFEQANDVLNPNFTDLLFAKPFEACQMINNHGYIPVMRPITDTDEVVILTRADDDRALADYTNAIVATASKDSFVYLLGRFLCDENDLDSEQLQFDFSGNEIKALQMLIRKKADLVFMLKKAYDGLSSFSRNSVRLLDESRTEFAHHLFCVAPHLTGHISELSNVLGDMTQDEQGKQILVDIQMQGWQKPEEEAMAMLQMVYRRYAG